MEFIAVLTAAITAASLATLFLAAMAVKETISAWNEIDLVDILVEGTLSACVLSTGVYALVSAWA